jgi:hypothetical protein
MRHIGIDVDTRDETSLEPEPSSNGVVVDLFSDSWEALKAATR